MSRIVFHERLNALQLLSGVILLLGSASAIWAQQHLQTETVERRADVETDRPLA
jgi:hypothetical protein